MTASALRRWVSVTEACDAIRGRRDQVKAWLVARGLVRRAPWGAVGVDLDEAMHQLAHEAEPVREDGDGPPLQVLVAPSAPTPPPAPAAKTPRRSERAAKRPLPTLRYEPIP